MGATIKLTKRIPVAAGLGGGSSDAAATLLGLNKLWNLNQSREDLRTIAESIGSDVPFFLDGGVAIVSGRGEQVRQLPPTGVDWAVILTPPTQLYNKTAAVYGAVTPSNYSAGALTRKLGARIHSKGDIPPQFLFNAFDLVAQGVFPNLDRYWRIFEGVGAREIHGYSINYLFSCERPVPLVQQSHPTIETNNFNVVAGLTRVSDLWRCWNCT